MIIRFIKNRKGQLFEVKLCEAGVALFDRHNWYVSIQGVDQKRHVVLRTKKSILFHRELLGFPTNVEIDHINGNCLDNRMINLRICNKSQNQANARKRNNTTSKYKGVSYCKERNKYIAQLTINQKSVLRKRFDSEIEAALAYNKKAKELFGQFAKLNVIIAEGRNNE